MVDRESLARRLRALADHPATPPAERASAVARLAEIGASIPVARPAKAPVSARFSSIKRRPNRRAFPDRWPFGWVGPRAPVEYESMPVAEGVALGWKCPGCGSHVERVIGKREVMARSTPGKPGAFGAYLNHLMGGACNQLCFSCWDRFELSA